jgi:hypothetical protein
MGRRDSGVADGKSIACDHNHHGYDGNNGCGDILGSLAFGLAISRDQSAVLPASQIWSGDGGRLS